MMKPISVLILTLLAASTIQLSKKSQWRKCKVNFCANGGECRFDSRIRKRENVCFCKQEYTGTKCQFRNPCFPPAEAICENGAQCFAVGSDLDGFEPKCVCRKGFKGRFCESRETQECRRDSCGDGICQLRKNRTEIFCVCPPGRHGDRCQFVDRCFPENPCENEGICTMTGNEFSCSCPAGWTGKTCSDDVDECSMGQPCSNNGKCVNTKGSFRCECAKGWTKDKQCRKWSNPCSKNPCQNTGLCRFDENTFDEFCDCPKGFSGKFCQIRAPGCSECQNGGSCEYNETRKSFWCVCPDEFGGDFCEKVKDPCRGVKCENGGVCSSEKAQCVCQDGFEGIFCETRKDFCSEVQCENQGKCVNRKNGFSCECKRGFRGEFCESQDPCLGSPCANGATCQPFGYGEFQCKCSAGFSGDRCEQKVCGCENGGQCRNGMECECSKGFSGDRCQHFADENPVIALNLSINNHGDSDIKQGLVNVFKMVLAEKFEARGSKLGQINVTKCDSGENDDDDCVTIQFSLPERGAVVETLNRIRAIRNLPQGVRVTNVRAFVRNGKSEPRKPSFRLLMAGIAGGCVVLALIAVIRTQTIIRGVQWIPPTLQNVLSPSPAKKRRKANGGVQKVFSKVQDFLEFRRANDSDQNTALLENSRALLFSILTYSHSTDQDKAFRLEETILIQDSELLLKILGLANVRTGESALHLAANLRLEECSRLLLTKYPCLAKCRDKTGRTPLHAAVNSDSASITSLIIQLSQGFCNINAVDSFGRTPLQQAALLDSVGAAEVLLGSGAKIDLVTKPSIYSSPGESALHCAAETDSLQCLNLLIQNGACLETMNDLRETALVYAIRSNCHASAELLISSGAKLEVLTRNNESPLTLAAQSTQEMLALVKLAIANTKSKKRKKSRRQSSKTAAADSGEIEESQIAVSTEEPILCAAGKKRIYTTKKEMYQMKRPRPSQQPHC